MLYAEHGVQEYWLVWPGQERVEVYRFAEGGLPRMVGAGDVLGSPLLPGFTLDVDALFARGRG
ncbi:MAG: putative restriction endonuclease [Cyanobacteria bacterium RYN_339]|nr:putative restriction endonuclease [Cyanobacteria bacterium RYN_339]